MDDPDLIIDFVRAGFGWAELPMPLVKQPIERKELVRLNYAFQQNDLLEGIDLVWTERRALGVAGQWLRDEMLKFPQATWLDEPL